MYIEEKITIDKFCLVILTQIEDEFKKKFEVDLPICQQYN
jgi:hypothetical protein